MRTKEELLVLLEDFKKWYTEDLKREYDANLILEILKQMKKNRVLDLLKHRLGHLKNDDFFAMIDLFTDNSEQEQKPRGRPKKS